MSLTSQFYQHDESSNMLSFSQQQEEEQRMLSMQQQQQHASHATITNSLGGLLGDKSAHVQNQQNNANNNNGSTTKILLNNAGLKAIQKTHAANNKIANFQQQAQQMAIIEQQHQQQLLHHQQQQALLLQQQQQQQQTFGHCPIPLPALHPSQVALLPALDAAAPETHPLLTVVFDLDETLVFNRRLDIEHALLRPYALHMLNALRQMPGVEIVLWTASTRETAAPVVEQLHSRGNVFDHLIFRDDRWFTDPTAHTKDLRLLGRAMNRVVIVDNQPNCCKLNPGNSILVEDYAAWNADDEAMFIREDAALVNLYYILDFMVQNILRGVEEGTLDATGNTVQTTLDQLANEGEEERGRLCRLVHYPLPQGWTEHHVRSIRPLSVPAHGLFVRACAQTPAPLESWTI